jgi:hypothetical protein
MDGDNLNVGMSDNDGDDDVCHHHPAGLLFWVQMLESSIPMPLLSDPLDMSMLQRNFVSHYYSMGEAVAMSSAAANMPTAKAMSERRRRRKTMRGS